MLYVPLSYGLVPVCIPGFLENINNMLTSGMVPALYPDDEKESIIGGVSCYLDLKRQSQQMLFAFVVC